MANKKINEFPVDSSTAETRLLMTGDPTSGQIGQRTVSSILSPVVQVVATHSAIGSSTLKRLIFVNADETNNGDSSLYIHNGTTLKFLQTVA